MLKREPFEPTGLVYGLPITGAGVVYVLEAMEVVEPPRIVLLLLVPAAAALGVVGNALVSGVRWACGPRRPPTSGVAPGAEESSAQ